MHTRMVTFGGVLLAVLFLLAGHVSGLNMILNKTQEELKLKYDVSVRDLGNGRVWVTFTITDEGSLKPLRSIELQIPGKEKDKDKNGGIPPELALSLATKDLGPELPGGKTTGFELTKELAERAEIWLMAAQLDGRQLALTGYVYRIPLAEYVKKAATAAPAPAPAPAAPAITPALP